MIRGFKHKGLKRLFERGDRSQIRADLVHKIENILATLDSAESPQGLSLPGCLHPLKGDRNGFWSVKVRANGGSFFASRARMQWMLS